jgi:lysozyme family protein
MSDFNKAVNQVLKHEGGFAQNWAEGGGSVNYGITRETYEKYVGRSVSLEEMKNLTRAEAIQIYYDWYWEPIKGDSIISYPIAFMLFDQGVNRGPAKAIKMAQKVLGLIQTGVMDSATLNALNTINERQFVIDYVNEAERAYRAIVSSNARYAEFLSGWLKRVGWLEEHAMENLSYRGPASSSNSMFTLNPDEIDWTKTSLLIGSLGALGVISYAVFKRFR